MAHLARIEIARHHLSRALSLETSWRSITTVVQAAGFLYVTLDTEGYRSGSMNAVLADQCYLACREVSRL